MLHKRRRLLLNQDDTIHVEYTHTINSIKPMNVHNMQKLNPPLDTKQDVQVCDCILYLEISSVYPNCCFRNFMLESKLNIQRPHPSVLSQRKGMKRTVKSSSCTCYFALVHQKLTIIQPNPRHLHLQV